MPKHKMYALHAHLNNDGDIVLRQEQAMDDDEVVIISAEQIPFVLRWIKELMIERKDFLAEEV